VRPDQCGTHQLPPDGTPDREEVDRFADFLRDVDRRGIVAVAADPAWRDYIDGKTGAGRRPARSTGSYVDGSGPRCVVCGAPGRVTVETISWGPADFDKRVTEIECSADPSHLGGL
jgi:hypothetical protein